MGSVNGADRVLVSGATGLLGSHLVERLIAQGHAVRALVRPTSQTRFLESLGVCLAYSVLAATIYLGADVLTSPATVTLIYPYWRAVARLISFSLISTTISLLVGERKRLHLSEQALREKTQELDAKNRALEETLRALHKLQEEIVAKERQAAIAEMINSATYEIERPLISISVHVDDLLRSVEPHEDIHPLVEKIAERVGDMEEILKNIRELRKERLG